jgi:hypothetical protein
MDRRRLASCSLALSAALLGVGSKFYDAFGANWVHHYAAGIFYELFFISLFAALLPRLHPWRIALSVLLATSLIELLQLWHPPFLQSIRSTFVGHALLGNTFSWWDFPHYIIGSTLGLALLSPLHKVLPAKSHLP